MTDKQYGAHGVRPDIPRDDVAARAAERLTPLQMLKEIEFGNNGYCPRCDGWMAEPNGATRGKHSADCDLAVMLSRPAPDADVAEIARRLVLDAGLDSKWYGDLITAIAAALTARDARAADAVAAERERAAMCADKWKDGYPVDLTSPSDLARRIAAAIRRVPR